MKLVTLMITFLSLLILLTSCHRSSDYGEEIGKIQNMVSANHKSIEAMREQIEQIGEKSGIEEMESQPSSDTLKNLWDIINSDSEIRDQFVKTFSVYGSSGTSTGGYMNFYFDYVSAVFDPERPDLLSRMEKREKKTIYDENMLKSQFQNPVYQNPEFKVPEDYIFLNHYVVIKFTDDISFYSSEMTSSLKDGHSTFPFDARFDALVLYPFENELFAALYKSENFIDGYKISPNYFDDILVKTDKFYEEIMNVTCGETPDC